MRTLNPSIKFLAIIIGGLVLTLNQSTSVNIVLTVWFIILIMSARVSVKKILKTLIPVALSSIGIFITAVMFSNQKVDPSLSSHSILSYSYAWMVSTRVLLFASLGMLFAYTTESMPFMYSLRDQLKVPNVFIYGLIASFNLVPNIREEIYKNHAAFRARGMNYWMMSPKVITPLVIKLVLMSDSMNDAMRSKRFDEDEARTQYQIVTVNTMDYIKLTTIVGVSVILVYCTVNLT